MPKEIVLNPANVLVNAPSQTKYSSNVALIANQLAPIQNQQYAVKDVCKDVSVKMDITKITMEIVWNMKNAWVSSAKMLYLFRQSY